MAQPRFTGHGFTNPLNPLSLHAENRYREPMPVMGDFQRYEAETTQGTQVFEGVGGFFARMLIRGGAKGGIKGGRRGVFKGLFRRGGVKAGAKGATKAERKAAVNAQAKILAKTAPNPVKQTAIRWGVAGVVGVVAVGYGAGIVGDAAEEWVCSMTGCNCDENATDAGHEEGTEEFTEDVEKCQKRAANKMANIAYAGVAMVGLVLFLILKPSKKKEE